MPCKEMRLCPRAPVGVAAPRRQPPKNVAGLVMHGEFATKSNQNAAPGTCWCAGRLLHRSVHGTALTAGSTQPCWARAPGSRQSDHNLCFVFQSPLTTATVAQKITQVRCCRSERHGPNSGSAPQPPAHPPEGAGDGNGAQK